MTLFHYYKSTESFEKTLKKRKKKLQREKKEKKAKDTITASRGNIIDIGKKKNKKNPRDLRHIKSYNCDKNNYYITLFSKPSKN